MLVGDPDVVVATTHAARPTAPAQPTSGGSGNVSVHGTTVTATVSGAHEGDWVYAYAYSTATGLGWAQVHNGIATWSIASAGLQDGDHHIAVIDDDGDQVGVAAFHVGAVAPVAPATASVSAAATSASRLAFTGADPSEAAAIAVTLLTVGGLLVGVRRIRSRRVEI